MTNTVPNKLPEKSPRQVHNYTSELELKSLLIRIKNDRYSRGSYDLNTRINERIKEHTELGELKLGPDKSPERNRLRRRMYQQIVEMSELTRVDDASYERFGEIILLMIQRILTRPNFSGYSYRHDFYSDAVYKIIKYLHNFDHTLISERSGQPVNAFAYISQYIHNSVIYIIGRRKRENDGLNALVNERNLSHSTRVKSVDLRNSIHNPEEPQEMNQHDLYIKNIDSMFEEMKNISEEYAELLGSKDDDIHRLNVHYPKDYRISFDEYNALREFLTPQISILRMK